MLVYSKRLADGFQGILIRFRWYFSHFMATVHMWMYVLGFTINKLGLRSVLPNDIPHVQYRFTHKTKKERKKNGTNKQISTELPWCHFYRVTGITRCRYEGLEKCTKADRYNHELSFVTRYIPSNQH